MPDVKTEQKGVYLGCQFVIFLPVSLFRRCWVEPLSYLFQFCCCFCHCIFWRLVCFASMVNLVKNYYISQWFQLFSFTYGMTVQLKFQNYLISLYMFDKVKFHPISPVHLLHIAGSYFFTEKSMIMYIKYRIIINCHDHQWLPHIMAIFHACLG